MLRVIHAVETKVNQTGANHYMANVPNSMVFIKYPKPTVIGGGGPAIRGAPRTRSAAAALGKP